MTFVLSWKFTLLRLVFGVILTFGVSYLANRFVPAVKQVDIDKIMEKAGRGGNRDLHFEMDEKLRENDFVYSSGLYPIRSIDGGNSCMVIPACE